MKRGLIFWLFFSIALLVSAKNAYSQTDTTNIKLETIYPGYVITIENDTINGFIKLTDKTKNQTKVLFYNSPDDPEPVMKFKPKELIAYRVGPRYYESFKFQPEEEANAHYFFLREVNGAIKVFKWYRPPDNQSRLRFQVKKDKSTKFGFVSGEEDLVSQSIAIKLGGSPVNLASRKFQTNFRKHMGALVEEDPDLVEKISNKEFGYTFDYMENIINEFNYFYLTVVSEF